MISAILTNAMTNALHAFFLLLYFLGAAWYFFKRDSRFTFTIVSFFFILLVLKVLGVYVHYFLEPGVPPAWVAVSLLTVFLNYLVLFSIDMPLSMRTGGIVFSLLAVYLFLTRGGEFFYISSVMLLVYLVCARYSHKTARLGFLIVVGSNLFWILARTIGNFIWGAELPIEYRYDNDIYHLLLIVATFVLYRSILRGDWRYPTTFR